MLSSQCDFMFYIKCAKPLIVALPSIQDRNLASAWIKRLAEDKKISKELQINYLKLLIYFLQRRKLGGPFLEHPNNYKILSDIPKDQNASASFKKRMEPYEMDFSGDLRTYVAYQEIENVGTHCYFALSQHPLTRWYRFDESIFPTGIKPGGVKSVTLLGGEDAPQSQELEELEREMKKNDFAAKLHNKFKNVEKKVKFLVTPLGKKPSKEDERVPPSWGSNLIQGPF